MNEDQKVKEVIAVIRAVGNLVAPLNGPQIYTLLATLIKSFAEALEITPHTVMKNLSHVLKVEMN